VYDADIRKLQNQARFIKEIIDGKLIVGKKRKDVLVQELRERKYEAFPRGPDAKKKTTEDELNESDNEDDDAATGGARDYDYLLSVR
jgi:DNA topoisomerase II